MKNFTVKLNNGTFTSVQALDLHHAQNKAEQKFGSSALQVYEQHENKTEEESMKRTNTSHIE
jgi:hypothetical protein